MNFKRLLHNAVLPMRQHDTDAGYDLTSIENAVVGSNTVVSTGVSVEIPPGHVGLIWDRSGLAAKHGITVLAGVVDSGYRGEVKVVLSCTQSDAKAISAGERIAQLLVVPCVMEESKWVDEFAETDRGGNGFGSTGQ